MRQKLLIIAIVALTFSALLLLYHVPSQRPVNEPQYQGRFLSEWLSDPQVLYPDLELADETGKAAVRAIGTNGLPYFLEWLHYEPGQLRWIIGHSWVHRWVAYTPAYSNWLNPPEQWRAVYGFRGFEILGTNAASAIPELTAMLNYTNKPNTSGRALGALCRVGPQAVPVLKAALADTNRIDRWEIAASLRYLGNNGQSNTFLPILAELLYDHDAGVQKEATLALEEWAPHLLTNKPAR